MRNERTCNQCHPQDSRFKLRLSDPWTIKCKFSPLCPPLFRSIDMAEDFSPWSVVTLTPSSHTYLYELNWGLAITSSLEARICHAPFIGLLCRILVLEVTEVMIVLSVGGAGATTLKASDDIHSQLILRWRASLNPQGMGGETKWRIQICVLSQNVTT